MAAPGFVCDTTPMPRQKPPKDGMGPRGVPDCYYTSRSLESTQRYVRFVKKLRATEEEQKRGAENNLQKLRDLQINDFFIRCDRRALINTVAHRVDLCMESYKKDLENKKQRLKELLSREEEENIRKFVVQAQAAREAIWQQKMDRLQYLLQKRQKEHEEKYKDTPLSKCTHVTPCIVNRRAKEAQEIQLYQMKENQARREADREFSRMWHEVAMRGSEALAARMEVDAIERFRRDLECKEHSDMILAQRDKQKEIDKQLLKQEQLAMREQYEEDCRKDAEAEELRRQKTLDNIRDCKEAVAVQMKMLEKKKEEDEIIRNTWASLGDQSVAADRAKQELAKRKERDTVACNVKMVELREGLGGGAGADQLSEGIRREHQLQLDRQRCVTLLASHQANRDARKAMIQQIQDRKDAREEARQRMLETAKYQQDVQKQLDQLLVNKQIEDAKRRKKHQMELVKQIEYNKLLKERALQEEMEQRKKAVDAAKEYQDEINKMACRPFFTEDIHPFMRQMIGPLQMPKTCPCAKNDTWCAKSAEK